MFGSAISSRRSRDEPEKPFWISYADLMTALMIMFLVVMSVALLAVTRNVSEQEKAAEERDRDIGRVFDQLVENVKNCGGSVAVDRERRVIDFGPQATFPSGSHQLTTEQSRYLRTCVPEILTVADNAVGRKWIKRIVVEGYTDTRGRYLYNLNLSLQRSQRVLCVLLAPANSREFTLTAEQRRRVRELFLVGGYSFNSAKESLEGSRRVELRLEFWGLGEPRSLAVEDNAPDDNDTVCELDPRVPPSVGPTSVPSPVTSPKPTSVPSAVTSPKPEPQGLLRWFNRN